MRKMKRFVQVFLAVVIFQLCVVPSGSSAIIDVMIVFDSTAKTWVADSGGMTAFANDAVAKLNTAAANSNLNLTFRLVHKAEASYTYSKNLSTDLTNLQAGSGNLSTVHQWRDTYGADIVVMMVDTGSESGWVGQGYLLDSYSGDPDYAYSVNGIRAVAISHTLTHEIGHNLGCDHSKTQKDSPGPNTKLNSYSAGWYFTGTDAEKYHTIMAYGDDGYGNSYTEAPLFSTPLVNYQEKAAGHAADGDNARTIRETMDVVAAYRVAVQQLLYAHFADAGIWKYRGDGTDWDQVTSSNPELLVTVGADLYGTFSGLGIWRFNGSEWEQTTTSVPQMIVGTGTTLYGAFSGLGIWQWNGTAWTQTTTSNPQKIVASTTDLYGTFAGLGIWKWNGSAWTQLTTSVPDLLVTSGEKLYGTFPNQGIWLWNGSEWAQATPSNPVLIAANSTTLYGSFTGTGIWSWTGSDWTQISSDNPSQMVASGSELYAAFTGEGVRKWNGTSWAQITPGNPVRMVVGAANALTLTPIGNKMVDESTTLSFVISAVNADGGTLTYSASALPSGATFDANSRTFSWTPTYSQSGMYQITFTAQDDSGGSDSETITITVNNKTPVFSVMDYFPLNIGDWHDYRAPSNGQVHRTNTTGPTYIGGVATKAKTYWDGQKEYYTADANGVKLYGQYVISQYITGDVYFSSPLLLMPNNAQIGKTQVSSSSFAFSLYGSIYHVNITSTTTILGLEDVQTANKILKDCIKASITFNGYIVETGQSVLTSTVYYWFYKGVGCVKQFMDGDTATITSSYVNGIQQGY